MLLATAPYGPVQILPGQRLAQALPLPLDTTLPALPETRGASTPGSSEVYWIRAINKMRPPLTITIEGQSFTGLLDSGADTTCISPRYWPPNWPALPTLDSVSGVAGTVKQVLLSSRPLRWVDAEGDSGTVTPYIIPDLPINLWGRDIMEQMHLYLIKCKDLRVLQQMLAQGYDLHKGLGKHLQGILNPIEATPKLDRHGLGYNTPQQPF